MGKTIENILVAGARGLSASTTTALPTSARSVTVTNSAICNGPPEDRCISGDPAYVDEHIDLDAIDSSRKRKLSGGSPTSAAVVGEMSVIGIAAHQESPGQGLSRSLDCRLMRNAARHLSLASGWNVPLRRPSDIPENVPGFRGFSAPPKRSHDRGVIVIQDDRHALADIGGTTICLRVWAWELRREAGIPGQNPPSSASGVNCDRMVLI